MKRMIALALASASGLLLGGCGETASQWAGRWEGDRKGLTRPEKEDAVARELRRITLDLRSDGAFTLVEMSQTFTGHASCRPEKCVLMIEKTMDKPVEPPKEVQLLSTGKGRADYWNPSALTPSAVEMHQIKKD